jgi:hypothetical protein
MINGSFRVTSPAPRDAWLEILQQDAQAMIFQTPVWIDAACSTGQYIDASRFYELSDGRQWLLPMLCTKPIIPGFATQTSLPDGWGQGGLLSNGPLNREDIHIVYEDLARQPVLRTLMHPNPLQASTWDLGMPPGLSTVSRISHILDLEGGFDQVWSKMFHSKTRTAIRKAEHSSLTVDWDSTGKYIPVFYEMFLRWAERRGQERHLPARIARWTNQRREPLERFEMIANALGEVCRVYVAWLDGQPVAASILLIFKQNAVAYRSTSIKELAHPVRANDMLQSVMIQEACRVGCRYYHRGESGGVASLMQFKSGFGATPVPFKDYSIERFPVTGVTQKVNGLMKLIEHQLMHASG